MLTALNHQRECGISCTAFLDVTVNVLSRRIRKRCVSPLKIAYFWRKYDQFIKTCYSLLGSTRLTRIQQAGFFVKFWNVMKKPVLFKNPSFQDSLCRSWRKCVISAFCGMRDPSGIAKCCLLMSSSCVFCGSVASLVKNSILLINSTLYHFDRSWNVFEKMWYFGPIDRSMSI